MSQPFTIRPPAFLTVPDRDLKAELDKWLQRIYTAHGSLDSTALKGPTTGTGFAVNTGSETITGSKTGIDSGLAEVTQVVASIDNGATATNLTVTSRVTPTDHSKIDIYVWKPTAAGDTTPIAATSPVSIHWYVSGTQT